MLDKLSILRQILFLCRKVLALQRKLLTERMVREVAAGEGLTTDKINLMVAVIWAESGMNPDAKNKNKDGSTDWGLCQFNDYWSAGQITPFEALNNPEMAARLMAKEIKAGRLWRWIGYTSGAYKKFL